MATFNVTKGGGFNIQKSISKVKVGLGWKQGNFDLDAHVFGCVRTGDSVKFYGDASHAVTYANEGLPRDGKKFYTTDKSIVHSGDNRTGAGDGDDESIDIDLSLIPSEINELSVFLTLFDAQKNNQTFGIVEDAYIRIINDDNNEELCKYNLGTEFASAIAIQVGSILKDDKNEWKFVATGYAFNDKNLMDILNLLQ